MLLGGGGIEVCQAKGDVSKHIAVGAWSPRVAVQRLHTEGVTRISFATNSVYKLGWLNTSRLGSSTGYEEEAFKQE